MNKRIFSVWSSLDGCQITMSEGIEQPKFVDGSPDSYCERLMFVIEAGSAEEAAAIQHLRLGWEPYRPMGKAAACPMCGSTFYPGGSGQCWNCDYVC